MVAPAVFMDIFPVSFLPFICSIWAVASSMEMLVSRPSTNIIDLARPWNLRELFNCENDLVTENGAGDEHVQGVNLLFQPQESFARQ